MRTLHLAEHEGRSLVLSPREAQELRALPAGFLGVEAGSDGWRITPGSRVGTIVLPSLRVVIRPKAGIRNVLFLLAYTRKIHWGADDFPYDTDDLVQAIAWWFDREAERAARYGLARDYVDCSDTLTTIRGRPAIERQLATRPGQRVPVECRFQEYSEDTPLNRVVKAAHVALLRMPGLDRALAMRLRHRARLVFGDVGSLTHAAAAVPEPTLTRLHREWRSAFRLARLILSDQGLRDAVGPVHATAFTVDMNQLFQAFISAIVRERLGVGDCTLEAGRQRDLTVVGLRDDGVMVPSVSIKPDLVLMRDGRPVAVGDVKYKAPRAGAGWQPADLYQLVTYCVRLKLTRGLLVYCGSRALGESRIVGAPLTLATIGVDVGGSPNEVLAHARRAADALIAHVASERGQAA